MSKPASYMEEFESRQPNLRLEPGQGELTDQVEAPDSADISPVSEAAPVVGDVALTGAQKSETEEAERYPDVSFNIDSTPFYARGVTSASIERCYRVSMKALAGADQTFEKFANRPFAEKEARVVDNFLGRSRSIGGKYQQPKQALGETEVNRVLQELQTELAEVNHPVTQLIQAIESRYAGDLKSFEVRDLTRKILVASNSKQIVRRLTKLLPQS